MSSSLRFAMIGCGVIAPTHARCIEELPGAELVAVCDVIPEKARALAEEFPAAVYSSCAEMFAGTAIDAVCVLTPSGLHAEVGIAAAQAGKHVLVEKPMDITLERADALINACRAAGVKLGVISQHRFDPALMALKQAVDEKRLGQLNFGGSQTKWYRSQAYYDSGDWRGTWALDGGGALINQSIHYVDLLQYIMGPAEEIHAYTATRAHERIEVEDIAVAAIKFRSGALGLLEGSTSAFPGFVARLDINGSLGSVIIENDQVSEWRLRSGEPNPVAPADSGFIGGTSSKNIWHHSHRRQIADFIAAIQEGREPLVSGEEGRKPLEIVLAVYESARTGKTVKLTGEA
ncbi:MAG: Gfo/Idh/MocA family oxidoreductase [Anaerolineaceae bacterium]|nr:Gfo/Idh/MocA family oxidoreductase [Anaerolineaceae bacterium]